MKKCLFAAIALGVMAFASCSEAPNGGQEEELVSLMIKLQATTSVEQPATRMVGPAAQTGQLTISNGHIFVLDQAGTVIANAPMNVAQATGTGQALEGRVATNSRVYVLANVPAGVEPQTLNTWDRIRQTAVTISASQQNNHANAALANTSGTPAAITVTGTGATQAGSVTVEVNPLFARMELTQVVGTGAITAFTVAGVYIDSYFDSFNLDGSPSGQIHYQAQSTNLAGWRGDAGAWTATGTAGNMTANPGAGNVWAQHVAAADLPRFILRLTGVTTTAGAQAGDRYVTVTGYSGTGAPARFERGRIYQVGTITFNENNLATTPNSSYVPLTVQVRMQDWIPVQLTPVL